MNEFNTHKKFDKQIKSSLKISHNKILTLPQEIKFDVLDLKENLNYEYINEENLKKQTQQEEQEEDFDFMLLHFNKTIKKFDCEIENDMTNENSSSSLSTKSTESEEDIQILRMKKEIRKRKHIKEIKNFNIKDKKAFIKVNNFLLNKKRISIKSKKNNKSFENIIDNNEITLNKIQNTYSNNIANKSKNVLSIKKSMEKKTIKSNYSISKCSLAKKTSMMIKAKKVYKEDDKDNNNDISLLSDPNIVSQQIKCNLKNFISKP